MEIWSARARSIFEKTPIQHHEKQNDLCEPPSLFARERNLTPAILVQSPMKKLFLMSLAIMAGLWVQAQTYRSLTVAEFAEQAQTWQGSPQVVNFWATWCAPCVAELPHFEKLAATYLQEGLRVVYVSLDFKPAALEKFLAEHPLSGEVIYLTDGLRDPDWIERTEASWSGAIPATLVWNPENQSRQFHEGSLTYEALEAWLKPEYLPNR